MNRLYTARVSIILAMCCFIIFMNIPGNFSFEQAYSQDLISNSYNIENLNEHFNIAIGGDWGCEEDTEKTVENIQNKNPELVIAAGDLSYEESADCWFEIIQPLKSKMKIAMGDHEYNDTSGGEKGIIDQYLKPLNLQKTYYSFDINNVHVTIIDPYIDYEPGSPQYHFIENDLKTASIKPHIDWTFVVESIPIYTSPAKHPADSTIRDTYHPLFDEYGVDLVFSSDNHNYQRTFPLNYNGEDNSDDPIIANIDSTRYNIDSGVIYLIIGTVGRSLYELEGQSPFVANQYDEQFGFFNIDIYSDKALRGTFYINEDDNLGYYHVSNTNDNIADHFIISNMKLSGATS